jgi:hypothetical protein
LESTVLVPYMGGERDGADHPGSESPDDPPLLGQRVVSQCPEPESGEAIQGAHDQNGR